VIGKKMDKEILSIAALVSAVVSILVSVIVKIVENIFKKRIEAFKIGMELKAKINYDIIKNKIETYNYIVKMVYKIRNRARSYLVSIPNELSTEQLSEIENDSRMLEEQLFGNEVNLKIDDIFYLIHEYKNTVINFIICARNFKKYSDGSNLEQKLLQIENMKDCFKKIDTLHDMISERVKEKVINIERCGNTGVR
jgi:hypothetical protein